MHLFLALGGLGTLSGTGLASGGGLTLGHGLDDTNSNGLVGVTDGETTERRVLSEGLDDHGLGGLKSDKGNVVGPNGSGVGVGLGLLVLGHSPVDVLEHTGNVGSVAIDDGGVTGHDNTRVVHDDDLSVEGNATLGRVVLDITTHETTLDILLSQVLDVETNVVTGSSLGNGFVVHLDGLDFRGNTGRGEHNVHTGLKSTGLNTTSRHCSDTRDLVNVLDGDTEGLVDGPLGDGKSVNGINQGGTSDLLGLVLGVGLLPALVPGSLSTIVLGGHVVVGETRDRDDGNGLGGVTERLGLTLDGVDDFVETLLLPLDVVHLVDGNNQFLDTKGVGETEMLKGLTVVGNTGLELVGGGRDNENGTIGLGGTSNHVLDEVTMTGGVNDGDVIGGGLELLESNVDSDTTGTFFLKLVKHPSVGERTLTSGFSLLLELLHFTLVQTTELVHQVTGGGRLSGVDVANNDHGKMGSLSLGAHFEY